MKIKSNQIYNHFQPIKRLLISVIEFEVRKYENNELSGLVYTRGFLGTFGHSDLI